VETPVFLSFVGEISEDGTRITMQISTCKVETKLPHSEGVQGVQK